MSAIRDALHRAADLVADALEQAATPEWISQDDSPLGKRAHLDAVRSGLLPARESGRLRLVRRVDMEAYLAKRKVKATVKAETLTQDESEDRAAERVLRDIRRVG